MWPGFRIEKLIAIAPQFERRTNVPFGTRCNYGKSHFNNYCGDAEEFSSSTFIQRELSWRHWSCFGPEMSIIPLSRVATEILTSQSKLFFFSSQQTYNRNEINYKWYFINFLICSKKCSSFILEIKLLNTKNSLKKKILLTKLLLRM